MKAYDVEAHKKAMEKYIKYQGGVPEKQEESPAPVSQRMLNAVKDVRASKAVSDSAYNDRDDLESDSDSDSNDDDDLTPMRE
jgi:hypothetical protein